MAYLFHIKIESINIYPLGGISNFNMPLNINPIKELLILIMGPIFQFLAYFLLLIILPNKKEIIEFYHYHILIFNLLPIIPLDGGKLLFLLLQINIPYYKSYKIIILISYLLTVTIIWHKIDLNIIITVLLVVLLVSKEYKKIKIRYEKFLLERYLKKQKYRKKRIITSEKNFYRNCTHLIKVGDKYSLEEEFLRKKYEKSQKSY